MTYFKNINTNAILTAAQLDGLHKREAMNHWNDEMTADEREEYESYNQYLDWYLNDGDDDFVPCDADGNVTKD